jgi:hypothetical protein
MLSPEDIDVVERVGRDLRIFNAEVKKIHDEVMLPTWETELHGLRHTLYGYMMMCFSYIDLFSAFWNGNASNIGQTDRMCGFMQRYIDVDDETANVAVQIWRHKLMHTGRPRRLKISGGTISYSWLLQWSTEHLPCEQHMRFNNTDTERILGMGLTYFLEDLISAWERYTEDLEIDSQLQINFSTARPLIEVPSYRS